MTMKLLAFYKGIQFAINPFKSCMRQRNAFQTDILFKFDLENDFLSMTLTYNHFGNKCNIIIIIIIIVFIAGFHSMYKDMYINMDPI